MRVGGDARPDSPLSVRVRLACPVSRPLNLLVLPSTCKAESRVTRVTHVIHRLASYLGVGSLFRTTATPASSALPHSSPNQPSNLYFLIYTRQPRDLCPAQVSSVHAIFPSPQPTQLYKPQESRPLVYIPCSSYNYAAFSGSHHDHAVVV